MNIIDKHLGVGRRGRWKNGAFRIPSSIKKRKKRQILKFCSEPLQLQISLQSTMLSTS